MGLDNQSPIAGTSTSLKYITIEKLQSVIAEAVSQETGRDFECNVESINYSSSPKTKFLKGAQLTINLHDLTIDF